MIGKAITQAGAIFGAIGSLSIINGMIELKGFIEEFLLVWELIVHPIFDATIGWIVESFGLRVSPWVTDYVCLGLLFWSAELRGNIRGTLALVGDGWQWGVVQANLIAGLSKLPYIILFWPAEVARHLWNVRRGALDGVSAGNAVGRPTKRDISLIIGRALSEFVVAQFVWTVAWTALLLSASYVWFWIE